MNRITQYGVTPPGSDAVVAEALAVLRMFNLHQNWSGSPAVAEKVLAKLKGDNVTGMHTAADEPDDPIVAHVMAVTAPAYGLNVPPLSKTAAELQREAEQDRSWWRKLLCR